MKKTTFFAGVFVLVASLGLQNPANAEAKKIICTNTNPPKNRDEARENGETFGEVVKLRESFKDDEEIDNTLIEMINENIEIGCSTAELKLLMAELTKTAEEIKDKRFEDEKASDEDEEEVAGTISEEEAKAIIDEFLKENGIEVVYNPSPEELENKEDIITEEMYKDIIEQFMKTGKVDAIIETVKAEYDEESPKTEVAKEMKEEKKPGMKMASATVLAPNTGVKKSDNLSLIAIANTILAGVSLVVFRKK